MNTLTTESPPAASVSPSQTQTHAASASASSSPAVSASLMRDDGTFAEGWTQRLPESLGNHRAMLANFRDLGGLAQALRDSMHAARQKGLPIPGEHAAPEERARFDREVNRLRGVPDSPEGYEFPPPAGLPEGTVWSEEAARPFREMAHRIGLSPGQVSALLEFESDRLGWAHETRQSEAEQLAADEQAEMRRRWGDGVDAALFSAQRLAATVNLPPDIFDPRSEHFLGVAVADAFHQLARKLGEGRLISGNAVASLDPESMARDIISNPNNPDHRAFHDASHGNSSAVRARVADLFRRSSAG